VLASRMPAWSTTGSGEFPGTAAGSLRGEAVAAANETAALRSAVVKLLNSIHRLPRPKRRRAKTRQGARGEQEGGTLVYVTDCDPKRNEVMSSAAALD